jgi:hypothetical protein
LMPNPLTRAFEAAVNQCFPELQLAVVPTSLL